MCGLGQSLNNNCPAGLSGTSGLSCSRWGPGRQGLGVAPDQLPACCLPCEPAHPPPPPGASSGSLCLPQHRGTALSGHTAKHGRGPGKAMVNLNQSLRLFIRAQMPAGRLCAHFKPPPEAVPPPGGTHVLLPVLSSLGEGKNNVFSSVLLGL